MKGMSLRKAINAKCKDCTYDPKSHGGTWRQQVEACAVTLCPLHPVRPRATSRLQHSQSGGHSTERVGRFANLENSNA